MAHIRKLQSNRYQVQIRLKDLKTISKTFSKKRDAVAFARKTESDTELLRKLGVPCENPISFQELANLYMAQYDGRDNSTSGRIKYWSVLFGSKQVTQIDEDDVDDGLIVLSKRVTGSTVNRYKSTLSAVFIYFIRHPSYKRLVRQINFMNPVRKESVSKFKENPPKNRFLDEDEQKKLLSACRLSGWKRLYLLVLMALTTGSRKGELTKIKWTDIDFSNRTAFLGLTKNGKPRYLPLTNPVITELMKFREHNSNIVFHNTKSKHVAYDFKKQWYAALKQAGIKHLRFHDLRHTAASNLVKASRTLFEVGTLLGHSSTQMTSRYAHLAIHDTQIMVDKVMGKLA